MSSSCVQDREADSVEMVSDVQHRTADVNRYAIEPDNVSLPPSATSEDDTDPLPQAGLVAGDIVEAQSTNIDTKTLHTHAHDPLAPQHTCFDSPTPGNEQSVTPKSEFMQPSVVLSQDTPEVPEKMDVVNDARNPNIIIFGEAGVGKSSVINLIAGQRRAHISNDALGCTFEYQRHTITLDGMPFAFWDTTGLDEGSEGIVPAKEAEGNLRALMHSLAHSGGIHLVIYCIRGTRLTRALKHNYDLFYTTVCRKKVPIALVVTGLEYQQGNTETWWDENEAALRRHGMWFDAHACVTTLEADDSVIRERRSDSQRRLRNLVVEYSRQTPCNIAASSISWATFRNIFSGASFVGKNTTRKVIIYDSSASCRTHTRLIGDRQLEYELVYIDGPLRPSASDKTAGLLVFYTSTLVDTQISQNDIAALETFYDIAGRETCPNMIVVLRGCSDDQVANGCLNTVALRVRGIRTSLIVDEPAKLDEMIEKLCIEHVKVRTSRLQRAYDAVMEPLWRWLVGKLTRGPL